MFALKTDNYLSFNRNLILDNAWFEGTVRLSQSSTQVPEPISAALLISGVAPILFKRKNLDKIKI